MPEAECRQAELLPQPLQFLSAALWQHRPIVPIGLVSAEKESLIYTRECILRCLVDLLYLGGNVGIKRDLIGDIGQLLRQLLRQLHEAIVRIAAEEVVEGSRRHIQRPTRLLESQHGIAKGGSLYRHGADLLQLLTVGLQVLPHLRRKGIGIPVLEVRIESLHSLSLSSGPDARGVHPRSLC